MWAITLNGMCGSHNPCIKIRRRLDTGETGSGEAPGSRDCITQTKLEPRPRVTLPAVDWPSPLSDETDFLDDHLRH